MEKINSLSGYKLAFYPLFLYMYTSG